MTKTISGESFRVMFCSGAASIDNHKQEINDLNVFPVPDGDTGTNMSLTMAGGADKLESSAAASIGRAAEVTASALLRSARGNSGVILSLLFRGIAKELKNCEAADSVQFAAALRSGVDSAYKAVMKPAEGTILTVSRLAADAAVRCAGEQEDIELVLEAAIEEGKVALADTINLNPVLKKADVIDAGGKGFLYILSGMLSALRGEPVKRSEAAAETKEKADFADFETENIKFAYCTEFIVEKQRPRDVNALRDFLDKRGDSIVVVDDDEIIKVHVHTNMPGVVLTEALTYGQFVSVKVENMRLQHTEKVITGEGEKQQSAKPEKHYGAVTVCAGTGLESIFRDLGVDGIITGGQTMNPSTEDILEKIEQTPAEVVFVLPNNSNVIMAAQQCVPMSDKKVIVIPTKTVAQGISAMLALEPDKEDDDANAAAMTEAASLVQTAMITYAARDSEFDGSKIREGEYLALLENTLLTNGKDLEKVIECLAEKLAESDPLLITVYGGADATSIETKLVESILSERLKDAELLSVSGGQPVYYYMIAAE